MKVDQNMVSISGDLVYAQEINMEVAVGAGSLVLKGLIEQYSNPTSAVLRELTSNAWDSHLEAGQTRPIEVSLPSGLSPHFIVEDFGVGMSREDMGQFGQFGHSTKRDTNDLIGSWGMGSKSPLAISSEYTVVGVKDGLRNVCVVGRREDGSPYMGFTTDEPTPTDLPNGVKITVPYSDPRPFNTAVNHGMFLGWLPGTISIDGVVNSPESSIHTYTERYDPVEDFGWAMRDSRMSDEEVGLAMVGPIRFPIRWDNVIKDDQERKNLTPILRRIVVNLPIGSVSIPSNRENLIYTPKTIAMIRQQVDGIIAVGKVRWQAEIDNAETMRDAWDLVAKANKVGYMGPFTYKGVSLVLPTYPAPTKLVGGKYLTASHVPSDFAEGNIIERSSLPMWDMPSIQNMTQQRYAILITEAGDLNTSYANRRGSVRHIHAPSKDTRSFMQGMVMVDGFTFPEPQQYYNRGGRVYFASESRDELGAAFVGLFNKTLTLTEFQAYARTYRSAKAKEARARSLAGTGTKAVNKKTFLVRELVIDSYGNSNWVEEVSIEDLDKSATYVLLQNGATGAEGMVKDALTTKKGYYRHGQLANIWPEIKQEFPTLHVLYLYKNEDRAVYQKELPNIMTAMEVYENLADKVFSRLSADQLQAEALRKHSGYRYWVSRARVEFLENIANPETRKMILDLKGEASTTAIFDLLNSVRTCLNYLSSDKYAEYTSKMSVTQQTFATDPLKRFPLLDYLDSAPTNKIVDYINMVDGLNDLESA